MTSYKYELVGDDYDNTANVPKDHNIWYKCTFCGTLIPSVPDDNIGCACGNVFIDKDCCRLAVGDMTKLVVLRKIG
jgi:hypothetical protein